MASETIRDRVDYKPIGTDPSQAEDTAGFGFRRHGTTNGTFRSKRRSQRSSELERRIKGKRAATELVWFSAQIGRDFIVRL
jgi:hypothetical protein